MSSLALQKFVPTVVTESDEKRLILFVQRLVITLLFVIFAYNFSDAIRKSFGIGAALAQMKNEEIARQLNALTYEFRFIVGKLMSQSESMEKEMARLREEVAELRDELGTKVPISHYEQFHRATADPNAKFHTIEIGDLFLEGRYVKRNRDKALEYYEHAAGGPQDLLAQEANKKAKALRSELTT